MRSQQREDIKNHFNYFAEYVRGEYSEKVAQEFDRLVAEHKEEAETQPSLGEANTFLTKLLDQAALADIPRQVDREIILTSD